MKTGGKYFFTHAYRFDNSAWAQLLRRETSCSVVPRGGFTRVQLPVKI